MFSRACIPGRYSASGVEEAQRPGLKPDVTAAPFARCALHLTWCGVK
jgi:hypothetical protein